MVISLVTASRIQTFSTNLLLKTGMGIFSAIVAAILLNYFSTFVVLLAEAIFVSFLIAADKLLPIVQRNNFAKDIDKFCSNSRKPDCLQELEKRKGQIKGQLKKGFIDEPFYESLIAIISLFEDRIKRNEAKVMMSILKVDVEDLIATYHNVLPLLYYDLNTITRKAFRILNTKKPFITYQTSFDEGGYFSAVLFKHRITKIINIILPSLHFLNKYGKDEVVKSTQDIMEKITEFDKTLFSEDREANAKKADFLLKIVTLLIAIIGSSIFTAYFVGIIKYLSKLQLTGYFQWINPFIQGNELIIASFVGFISGFLISVIFGRYFSHKINWYLKMVRMNNIQVKEERILDHLKQFQLGVLKKLYYKDV